MRRQQGEFLHDFFLWRPEKLAQFLEMALVEMKGVQAVQEYKKKLIAAVGFGEIEIAKAKRGFEGFLNTLLALRYDVAPKLFFSFLHSCAKFLEQIIAQGLIGARLSHISRGFFPSFTHMAFRREVKEFDSAVVYRVCLEKEC